MSFRTGDRAKDFTLEVRFVNGFNNTDSRRGFNYRNSWPAIYRQRRVVGIKNGRMIFEPPDVRVAPERSKGRKKDLDRVGPSLLWIGVVSSSGSKLSSESGCDQRKVHL